MLTVLLDTQIRLMMKKIIYAFICVLFAGSFTLVAVKAATQTKRNQKLQDIQIQSKDIEATKLEVDLRRLNIELKKTLEDKNINESKVKDLEKQIEDAQKREERLQEQLQAKAKAKADAKEKAALAQRKALGTSKAYAASGNKESWLLASGIPKSQWWAVDYIVSRESGWNPCAYYPSKSNCNLSASQVNATCASHYAGKCAVACGLGMSLACGKWGSNWTDPVNQLKHMNTYVSKFGGWAGAVSYWQTNHHY